MKIIHKQMSVEMLEVDQYKFLKGNVEFCHSAKNAYLQMVQERRNFDQKSLISQKICKEETQDYFSCVYMFDPNFILETRVGIDKQTSDFFMEIVPIKELEHSFLEIIWPRCFEEINLTHNNRDSYLVLPYQQGLILPNDWNKEIDNLHFDGQFCSAAAYMPWLGYVSQGNSWQYIVETPWDSKYKFIHKAGGPTKEISIRWLPSLATVSYSRKIRLKLSDSSNYNKLCKDYRQYMKDNGTFYSLKDKLKKNPKINQLNGASIVHTSIKTNIVQESRFYNHEQLHANSRVVTFAQRQKEIERYKQLGAGKLYVHLDGWGQPGYDNGHPDYLPACQEAGGWKGLKALTDYLQTSGDLIGLHDQYRDYYFNGPTFDVVNAVMLKDKTYPKHAMWAGGQQTYLCATLAPNYVERNFKEIFKAGIHPDASYLDVFTCNEPDECFNPTHRMTRQESLTHRLKTFEFLRKNKILSSSEECTDWALKELVFCHYGPYEFMLKEPGSDKIGIPVPLFNLVYHDSIILPWMMEKHDNEDYMLYALLNAGMPYLIREGAYPNIDGSFTKTKALSKQDIMRVKLVSQLQEKLAFEEMIYHTFSKDGLIQEAKYSDGTIIRIDLEKSTYEIIST